MRTRWNVVWIGLLITALLGIGTYFFVYNKNAPSDTPIDLVVVPDPEPTTPILINETAPQEPDATKDIQPTPSNWCPKPSKTYPDYSFLDVGQTIAIPDPTYIPSDLVPLPKSIVTTPICLKKDASDSLQILIAEAQDDGYAIKVSSGFRSYATQKGILERDIASGNKNATLLVAKPGYSEHQLGVAVDLTSPSISNSSAAGIFANTEEAAWLAEHAYEYGFIESYPKDKEDITGYLYESWHYRYVGKEYAQAIHELGFTTNQFLASYHDSIANQ